MSEEGGVSISLGMGLAIGIDSPTITDNKHNGFRHSAVIIHRPGPFGNGGIKPNQGDCIKKLEGRGKNRRITGKEKSV